MVNNRVTEFQIKAQTKGWKDDQQARCPTTEDEVPADSAVHDGHVMQGFADGHTAVIGHYSQQKKLCCSKEDGKKYLNEAGFDGNDFALS